MFLFLLISFLSPANGMEAFVPLRVVPINL